MKAAADRLLKRLRAKGGNWPPQRDRQGIAELAKWIAFRESDRAALKVVHGWENDDRRYRVDPLPDKMALSFADLLFGQNPQITPAAEGDITRLEELLEASEIFTELHRAEHMRWSEGEIWWRILSDHEVLTRPVLEWHSRWDVVPQWSGPQLIAVGFVQTLDQPDDQDLAKTIHRRLEIHTEGRIENVLFAGTKDKLGQPVDLARHEQTAGMTPVVEHALPMLAGRIHRRLGRDPKWGLSGFHGIEDFLLDLNECATIGAENARLTAKKRVEVPAYMVRPPDPEATLEERAAQRATVVPAIDAGVDAFVRDPFDTEAGAGDSAGFRVLEYSFEATELIAWIRHLVDSATTRVGLTAQWLGTTAGNEGRADTGTALRARLLPTTAAGQGAGRPWDPKLRHIVNLLQRLDSAPLAVGGFERPWDDATSAPAVERTDPLPDDPDAEVDRHARAVEAGIEAPETAVEELHPEWDDERRQLEMERIRQARKDNAPAPLFGGTTPPAPEGEGEQSPPGSTGEPPG